MSVFNWDFNVTSGSSTWKPKRGEISQIFSGNYYYVIEWIFNLFTLCSTHFVKDNLIIDVTGFLKNGNLTICKQSALYSANSNIDKIHIIIRNPRIGEDDLNKAQ